ncbi:MAG TPA: tyrosine-type recombinase/integrase [Kribbella sp.]|uniref:site-specific integrase n=1 Tax=Kribbella sp. TaxID=1871183 RepID=UPI002D76CDD8|nr:tyrosine-type recombinase/integrase [Kribbella sp.]HET6294374.1 tyrosine-type recombinase/integrase [Kribbella sp.]
MRPGAVTELLAALSRRAILERPVHPHMLRHAFASNVLDAGGTLDQAQALLGHASLASTQVYAEAIYSDDVITHHRAFIARRRAERPGEEYRSLTPEEWEEFLGHFELRKVALGICTRDYGTPCVHEHACIRCPMLTLSPKMLPRLDELEADLVERRTHALANGWKGEIEGLDLTLTFLRSKRTQTRRSVNLGMPAVPAASVQSQAQ